jgi:hypothetical protein
MLLEEECVEVIVQKLVAMVLDGMVLAADG